MNVRYLVFFFFTKILCDVFAIPTSVSNRDSNSDRFAIGDGFEKSSITTENGNSVTNSLQSTLRTAKNFASNLYYGENQQIRGDKRGKCGWIKRMLCCFFPCCRENGEEKNADRLDESSSEASKVNIYREDTSKDLTNIDIESEPEIAPPKDSSEAPMHTGTESEPKINTTPHLVRQNTIVSTIREWMQSDPSLHFPPTALEDRMIERFYYVCLKNVQRTQEVIELFFRYRSEMPRIFTDRDPLAENLQKIMNVVYVLPLPKKTQNGQQLYLINFDDENVGNFNFLDFVKAYYNITDVRMKTDEEIPTGDIPIFDISHFSRNHYTKLKNSEDLNDYLKITQEANPVSLQKIHVINAPFWLRWGSNIASLFLNTQVREKVIFHKGVDELFQTFPASHEVMPSEYHGKGGSIADIKDIWRKKLEQNRDWLMTNPWRAEVPPQPPQES